MGLSLRKKPVELNKRTRIMHDFGSKLLVGFFTKRHNVMGKWQDTEVVATLINILR